VLGLQWGDEGKGKVVDERAAGKAAVMRYQGGANAGHTLVVDGRRLALHQLPAGALRPDVRCIIGAGCAVDPLRLREEVDSLTAAGWPLSPRRLCVSARAQVVLPWMPRVDAAEEALRGDRPIGTTGRGIGPAYAAKAGRWGLTVGALVDPEARAERLAASSAWIERWRAALGLAPEAEQDLAEAAAWLRPFVGDDLAAIRRAGGEVLLEGQLGVMRDPDRGAYPFVTGASVLPPAALVPPGSRVIGVAKPYVTVVGEGPLPTEAPAERAEALRRLGGEFGATTGRPRRCGWLDLPALRYGALAAGATHLAVTKCDVAATLGEVPVCVRYDGWDERAGYPLTHALPGTRPVYETWSTADPLALARRMAEAAGLPLAYVGTGAGRGQGKWWLAA
jgi:adenylosuccinate synthase